MDYNEMARMMSNATGMDLESAYGKVFSAHLPPPIRNFDDLRQRLDTGPLKPMSRVPGVPISAKEFVDMATKNFGMDQSSALAAFARETGRDLESVIHEASAPDLKPFNGTFNPSSTRPWASPPAGVGSRFPSACAAPLGSLRVRPENQLSSASNMRCDESATELLRTVFKYATSGNNDYRRVRRDALRRLGECGCTSELCQIVIKYATAGDCDARETRRSALEMLGPEAEEELFGFVLRYLTSGDCDARETRRAALEKLGSFGCTDKLIRVVRKVITSGDCDARETRTIALNMLGPDAADGLLRIVMDYATSGDCDARETRQKALRKLGEFGCRHELARIAERFARSSDCDAQECRRMALEMLG